jgi:hypothetical protein
MFLSFRRMLLLGTAGCVFAAARPLLACLSTSADTKAVQWSTVIVQAKLLSILVGSGTEAAIRPGTADDKRPEYAFYQFLVSDVYDGTVKAGDSISVARLIHRGVDDESDCGQKLSKEQIGKSFVLLLWPSDALGKRQFDFASGKPKADGDEMEIVYLSSVEDVGTDGISYLKTTIAETRDAEAKFSAEDAKLGTELLDSPQIP